MFRCALTLRLDFRRQRIRVQQQRGPPLAHSTPQLIQLQAGPLYRGTRGGQACRGSDTNVSQNLVECPLKLSKNHAQFSRYASRNP
jgi:hypothetical protein